MGNKSKAKNEQTVATKTYKNEDAPRARTCRKQTRCKYELFPKKNKHAVRKNVAKNKAIKDLYI